MDRIAATFARARSQGRACFVSYVCAGDPDFETSLEVCRTLLRGGTDILELGVPFSDPLADGLTNQLAAERALAAGMTQARVLELVRCLRAESEAPIVFYTYYNLMFARGVDATVRAAHEAGVDGILTLDLPPEEAGEMQTACARYGVKTVLIVAPTTPDARLELIGRSATGFIYYVSREGVTGERAALAEGTAEAVSRIKAHTDLPVVVGFGISNAEQVRQVGGMADGVVVGSALVNCIGRQPKDRPAILRDLAAKMAELGSGLR